MVYPLPEVLLIVLCGTMAGAEDLVETERWAGRKLDFLRRMLPFARGIPSHDTLNDVMNVLPAGLFAEAFTAWVEALRDAGPDIVAIDGKTSRRARAGAAHPPRTRCALSRPGRAASAWSSARRRWSRSLRRPFDTHTTTDGDHGRIEIRRHTVSHDVGWLATGRRFPGEPRFPGVAAIGMVEAEVEPGGKLTVARRYDISSAPLTTTRFARAVRSLTGSHP